VAIVRGVRRCASVLVEALHDSGCARSRAMITASRLEIGKGFVERRLGDAARERLGPDAGQKLLE
jgi:hypothetical protein